MSDRMTSVRLPGGHGGFADYGRRNPQELIAELRVMAAEELSQAQAVLDADDNDFIVETYIGIHVRRQRERLWPIRSGGDAA